MINIEHHDSNVLILVIELSGLVVELGFHLGNYITL